jgi:hypothetical protein
VLVADNRRNGDYYRIIGDDRLMWGGRISARTSVPWRLQAALRHDILKVYPQLGDFEIDYAWSGTMAYAVHKMPQIGELAPGYWLASAFGGHGLNTTAMAGEMIARAILDGDDRWRLFSPYELVWAGGRLGRAAAQAVFWSMQLRDTLQERIARYRDRARREAGRRQQQWEAEKAARRAAAEARRAEEAANRLAQEGSAPRRRHGGRAARGRAGRARPTRRRSGSPRKPGWRARPSGKRRAPQPRRRSRMPPTGRPRSQGRWRSTGPSWRRPRRRLRRRGKPRPGPTLDAPPAPDVMPTPARAAPDIAPSEPVASRDDTTARPKKPRRQRSTKKKNATSTAGPEPDTGT